METACLGSVSPRLSPTCDVQLAERGRQHSHIFLCCLRDVTYVDVEEGWCQGRTMRDSIVNSSQAADLTVTSSQSETSVGEKFHHKRDHIYYADQVACTEA